MGCWRQLGLGCLLRESPGMLGRYVDVCASPLTEHSRWESGPSIV